MLLETDHFRSMPDYSLRAPRIQCIREEEGGGGRVRVGAFLSSFIKAESGGGESIGRMENAANGSVKAIKRAGRRRRGCVCNKGLRGGRAWGRGWGGRNLRF